MIRRSRASADRCSVMQTALWKKKQDSTFIEPAVGAAEYKQANEKFQAKEYKAAEKEFKAIVKKYKNDPIKEDAQFMVAECQYEQKKYSWAQDSYDQLLIDFPSTRHLDQTTKRLFSIARYWLQEPTIVKGNDIQQVNLEEPGSETPEIPAMANSGKRGGHWLRTSSIARVRYSIPRTGLWKHSSQSGCMILPDHWPMIR